LIFKKIRLIGKGLSKQLELNFKIQNPTNQTGVVSAITGEVYVNDRIVADFSSFGEQKIAPKSESDFKVIATPTIGIIQLLTQRGLLKSGLKYKIKGTGNFDGIVAPFEYTAKLV
jgi:LEA14-like dessication related protein